MKISKLVWSVFVGFVAVGLAAPKQAEAVAVTIDMVGQGTSGPPNAAGETTFVPSGMFGVSDVSGNDPNGIFTFLLGANATFKSITCTNSGSSAKLKAGTVIGEGVAA